MAIKISNDKVLDLLPVGIDHGENKQCMKVITMMNSFIGRSNENDLLTDSASSSIIEECFDLSSFF